jgi:catechol 2,3-dioxygenase-like lactoylglutathione lyase family enzyme
MGNVFIDVMKVNRIDHLVLTTSDIEQTINFYTTILGMELISVEGGRKSLRFGTQKINLHEAGQEISPHARHPLPGSTDLCFITETSIQQVVEHLHSSGITLLKGPTKRIGATGPLFSIYIQDPDGNLLELSNHLKE